MIFKCRIRKVGRERSDWMVQGQEGKKTKKRADTDFSTEESLAKVCTSEGLG